jgi:hypothetical protein
MPDETHTTELVAVVALAALVVLAGCGALQGGPTAGPGDGGTTPDVSGVTFPPGVNGSGVTDVGALLAAHRTAMVDSGFVYRFEHRMVTELPNNTTVTEIDASGEVRAARNLTATRESIDREAPDVETVEQWSNGTAGFQRVTPANTTFDRTEAPSRLVTTHHILRNLVARDTWNVTAVADDGSRIVLRSDNRTDTVGGREISDTVDGRMVLDGDGRILQLTVTVENREYSEQQEDSVFHTRTLDYDVTQVGNVSVSAPDWVDEARNATDG